MTDDELQFEIEVHNILLQQALTRRRQWLQLLTDTDREVERLQCSMRDLQQQLEAQSHEASASIQSTPASPAQADKRLSEWELREGVMQMKAAMQPKDRRESKERRVLKSEESPDGTGFWNGTDFYPNRRKIARRKSDRREE